MRNVDGSRRQSRMSSAARRRWFWYYRTLRFNRRYGLVILQRMPLP
jgi:hypothetical protein